MIHVVAEITTQPGKRQEILDIYRAGLPDVLAEAGCVEYSIVVDAATVGPMHTQAKLGPDTFFTIEKWESLKHLEDHSSQPSMDDYHKNVVPLMSKRIVHFLENAL